MAKFLSLPFPGHRFSWIESQVIRLTSSLIFRQVLLGFVLDLTGADEGFLASSRVDWFFAGLCCTLKRSISIGRCGGVATDSTETQLGIAEAARDGGA